MISKTNIALIVLLFSSFGVVAQTTIELRVKQSIGSRAKLSRFVGKEIETVDSCRSNEDGVYKFTLPSNANQGLYRMVVGKQSSFDFIVANEPEIKLETVVFAVEDSLRVLVSKENKVFVDYLKIKRASEQQLWMLGSLQNYYTSDQPFAEQLRNEKQRVEFEFSQKSQKLSRVDTALFVSNYISLDTKPFVVGATSECSYKALLAKDWWNGVNLNDDRLLNTPLLIKNVWDYLENSICDDIYDKEQQDSVFVSQIDVLLKMPMSERIRLQIVGSLCRGFMDTDYFGVLNYLLNNGGEAASVLKSDNEFMARLVLEKNLVVGNKSYDFKVKPISGKQFKLSADKANYKLVVFWSIWCPHCVEMMPSLISVYNNYKAKGFEIVAISIDEEVDQWRKFVADKQFPWINMQINADYDNPIIIKYNVDETPKMFLVDKNLKIVSRPSSAEQLRLKLKKLL